MDSSVGATVTLMAAVAVLPEAVCVAVMVAFPTATPLTVPAVLTVATLGAEDRNVEPAVMFPSEPSLYVPTTVSCTFRVAATVAELGESAMETSVGAVTLTVADAFWPEAVWVAVMVAVPMPTAVTSPVGVTVATAGAEEMKVEVDVRLAVEESLYVPVTVSCCVPARLSVFVPGVTAIETSVGMSADTVMCVVAVKPAVVAVTVAAPSVNAVTTPALLTDTTDGALEENVRPDCTGALLPLPNVAVTTNCWVCPVERLTGLGLISMEESCAPVS